jgi:hypothetical protein
VEKRLVKIREKMAQMKAREHDIIARAKEHLRKERTRRLIQNGALAEKYLNCEEMTPRDFENKLREVVNILKVVDK